MILELDNILLIPRITELMKEILPVSVNTFENMIVDAMASKKALILIDKKDEEIRGFVFATIEQMEAEDIVFIQISYIRPEYPKIGFELLARVRTWAKKMEIKNWIYMITPRDIKGFEKKYKFRFYGRLLRRRIDETSN